MEPPTVTSCSQSHPLSASSLANSVDRMRRGVNSSGTTMPSSAYHLQIDPNLTFNNSVNRPFEELPENFLESISPQQSQSGTQQESPQLAPLAPMSLSSSESPYVTLSPMSTSSSYGIMKLEPLHELHHHTTAVRLPSHGSLDKMSFSSGPAGLLSPLHSNRNDAAMGGSSLLGVHQNGGRTSEMLSALRRPTTYIKEEVDISQGFNPIEANTFVRQHIPHQISQATVIPSEQHQQELDSRLANAETPPAVSNVEIASSFIATMTGEQPPDSPVQQSSLYQPSQSAFTQQIENAELSSTEELEVSGVGTSEESVPGVSVEEVGETSGNSSREVVSGASRTLYSTKDTSDPLNAEIDDDIYIDTKDLCKRIAWELKQHSIPQAIFAERILCRSQGTLSDLLRNPKPWNKLKSGRETFRRMFNWVQLPLSQRLGILEIYKDDGFGGQGKLNLPSSSNIPMILSPPTPAQNARQGSKHKNGHDSEGSNSAKRPRLVFTDIQKRTLQAIFKETQRPSREMQQTIAEHLRLDLSTVANFFMNARRRSRSGPLQGDVPAPYQQVRPITPPPASPPQRPLGRSRNARHASRIEVESTTSVATSSHIENTVAQVAEEAAEYARNVEQVIRLEPSAVVNSQQDLEDDRIEGRDTLPLDSDSNNVLRGDEKTLKTEEPDHNKSQVFLSPAEVPSSTASKTTYEGQGNSTTSPSVFENKDPVKTKQENLSDSET